MSKPLNPLIEQISLALSSRANCIESGNVSWLARWDMLLDYIERTKLPSGSGIDNGCKINRDSKPEEIRFDFAFHHMDSDGFYTGWSDYQITVRPSFVYKIDFEITGRDESLNDYFVDTFREALMSPVALRSLMRDAGIIDQADRLTVQS